MPEPTAHPPTPKVESAFQADWAVAGLAGLIEELKLYQLDSEVAILRSQLANHHALTVAVFGGFKAGKSSFLNHLAACDALPVGVVPVTAVVTRLSFGERAHAAVSFLDDTVREIPLSEVKNYVSEVENPENRKRVATVEIEVPSLRSLAPLEFVDTPGLGSALAHNTEATMRWLPNVEVALVAVSSETPLSDRDLGILDQLSRHTPRTALLLTKADLLAPAERQEILAFVRRQLGQIGKGDLPVHFYSVRPGEQDFRAELERGLFQPLLRDRSEATRQISRHKLLSLADRALDYARVNLAAATQTEANRRSLRARLVEERREFALLEDELRLRTRDWSSEFFDWTLTKLEPTQEALRVRLRDELQSQFRRWHTGLPGFLRAWRSWMQEFIARELEKVSCAEEAMFQTPLRNARTHLERTLQAFHDRLAGHVQAALGIALAPRKFALPRREAAVPPVDVSFAFGAAFDMIAGVLPLTLLRPVIERLLQRKAQEQLTKNLSRLASAWRDRVMVEIAELVRSAKQQAADELQRLEQAVTEGESSEPRLREIIAELESWRSALDKS